MKRALFFTLIAIVLSALFVASFTFYIAYKESRQLESSKVRINSMNEFVKSVERDMQRALYIASFRAILSMSDYITTSGKYVNDTEKGFVRLVFNGTVGNRTTVEPLMVNQTILNWSKKIMQLSQGLEVSLNLKVINVSVFQDAPWEINTVAYLNFTITDSKQTAAWTRLTRISSSLPVENFEDPIYMIKSNGKVARRIVKSNITAWNISALKLHLLGRTFTASSSAPSFLKRLEGNLTASPQGIETLVDTNELRVFGLTILDRSSVDYIYWGAAVTVKYGIHNITDKLYPDFRLDNAHVASYNVRGYNYTI